MYVSRSGRDGADPVLLLHGGGVAGWMWDSLRARLEPTHAVIVPDLPGHGHSADESYVSHADTLRQLRAYVDAAVPGRPLSIIGFSLGAQLAIRAASEWSGLVRQVAVVSAQARPLPFARATLGALRLTAPLARQRWFARLQARELFIPPHLMDDYVATSAAISTQTLVEAVRENIEFRLPTGWPSFPGRALVMVGAEERALMRTSAADIHAALPASVLGVVEGCGHGIPLQRPERFGDRMAGWLGDASSLT